MKLLRIGIRMQMKKTGITFSIFFIACLSLLAQTKAKKHKYGRLDSCYCIHVSDSVFSFQPPLKRFVSKQDFEKALSWTFRQQEVYERLFIRNLRRDRDNNRSLNSLIVDSPDPVIVTEPNNSIALNLTPCQPTRNINEYLLPMWLSYDRTSGQVNCDFYVDRVAFEINSGSLCEWTGTTDSGQKKALMLLCKLKSLSYTNAGGFIANGLQVCKASLCIGHSALRLKPDTLEYIDNHNRSQIILRSIIYPDMIISSENDVDGMAPPKVTLNPLLGNFTGLLIAKAQVSIEVNGKTQQLQMQNLLANNHFAAGTLIMQIKKQQAHKGNAAHKESWETDIKENPQIKGLENELVRWGIEVASIRVENSHVLIDFLYKPKQK